MEGHVICRSKYLRTERKKFNLAVFEGQIVHHILGFFDMVQGIVGGEAVIDNRKPCILVHQTANSILSFVHFGLQLEKIEIILSCQ